MDERRTLARGLREQSQGRKRHAAGDAWVDVDTPTALRWMREAGTSTLIHGHTHRPASEALAPGQVREVLSDWDLDHEGPPRAEVLRLDARGLRRIAPINCELRGT
jgi:UDP-2,3-diacylglucosamine hydrolase